LEGVEHLDVAEDAREVKRRDPLLGAVDDEPGLGPDGVVEVELLAHELDEDLEMVGSGHGLGAAEGHDTGRAGQHARRDHEEIAHFGPLSCSASPRPSATRLPSPYHG